MIESSTTPALPDAVLKPAIQQLRDQALARQQSGIWSVISMPTCRHRRSPAPSTNRCRGSEDRKPLTMSDQMAPLKALIFDIKKFAIHDGPGSRTTVFFKGCPLSCWSLFTCCGDRPDSFHYFVTSNYSISNTAPLRLPRRVSGKFKQIAIDWSGK